MSFSISSESADRPLSAPLPGAAPADASSSGTAAGESVRADPERPGGEQVVDAGGARGARLGSGLADLSNASTRSETLATPTRTTPPRGVTLVPLSERGIAAQYAVSEILADSSGFAEAVGPVLGILTRQLDWELATCWCRVSGTDRVRCTYTSAREPDAAAMMAGVSRGATVVRGQGLPGQVWETAQPCWIEDLSAEPEFNRRESARVDGLRSAIAFPIRGAGRMPEILGVIELFNRDRREPDSLLVQALVAIGNQLGQFIERKRAERAVRRSEEGQRLLADASRALASSLDFAQTLQTVAALAVPTLADLCVVHMREDDGVRLLAVAHRDPAHRPLVEALEDRYPTRTDFDVGPGGVIRSRVSELMPEVNDAWLVARAIDDGHLALLRELEIHSYMAVPLVAREETLGALSFVSTRGKDGRGRRRYDETDLRLAEELGRRAGVAIDNARLYRAEREARRRADDARLRADEANRAKTDFLAMMSHELRTPLNAIAGYAELLEMGVHGPLSGPQLEDIRRIQRAQHHLLSLINDVLNFVKIEAGRLVFDIGPLVMSDVLGQLEGLMAPQLQQHGLRYELAPVRGDLVALADGEKVRQILLNLLSNAIKFTPRGGRIALACERMDDGRVHVRVCDSGVGIPTDKLERIFEPFVQLGRGLTSTQEGTGLGLAISRDLARAMGGDLVAESVPGEGATFTVMLPGG